MVPYQQADTDGDHQFEPGRKLGDDLCNEGGNGVSVVRLVEFSFIQSVDQNDEILLWNLPFWKGIIAII